MKKLIKQILNFGIVGVISFFIDYGILYLFTECFNVNIYISNIISFSVSTICNYILSIYWVFKRNRNKNILSEFRIYLFLNIIGLGINQIIIYSLVEYIQMYYMIAKIFATGIVMIYNFITRKVFIEGIKLNLNYKLIDRGNIND